MLNFIICEDNENIIKINEKIIQKKMMKNDFNYKIYSFKTYNTKLKELIKESVGKKVYIVDIELGNVSGIDIVRDIRKEDWDSFIIFSTAHSELFPQIFKDRLMIFDFISKFDNYKNNLLQVLDDIINIYSSEKFLTINIRKTIYHIRHKDILYFLYDKLERKTILITFTDKFKISKSMKSIIDNLPNNFVRINNHCVINKNNIKKISSDGKIIFNNDKSITEIIKNKELV